MVLRAACVLRSGGEYLPKHVERLRASLARYLSGVPLLCLSDFDMPEPSSLLLHGWPGWWSKLELMRPDIEGDLLYFDLDTVITGGLSELAAVGRLTLLRDFIHPERLQSSLMYLPQADRWAAWERWMEAPSAHMRRAGPYGDQHFLGELWQGRADTWQAALPGQVVSYKVDVRPAARIPDGTRVVIFHGEPRPWAVGWLNQ
jgi:hypothetical protein